jgi:hypothetical protein
MIERDEDPDREGSGSMLFQALKSLLMMLPQSTCYSILRDRLTSVSRFRQGARLPALAPQSSKLGSLEVDAYVNRVQHVRALHCAAAWQTIRAESLEVVPEQIVVEEAVSRREWLGYASKKEDDEAQERYRDAKNRRQEPVAIEEDNVEYQDLTQQQQSKEEEKAVEEAAALAAENEVNDTKWQGYWVQEE